MKATISLDNAVLEQLLAYTQAKTAKESTPERLKNISALSNARSRGSVEIANNWQQLRDLERT